MAGGLLDQMAREDGIGTVRYRGEAGDIDARWTFFSSRFALVALNGVRRWDGAVRRW